MAVPFYQSFTETGEQTSPIEPPRMVALVTGLHNAQWANGQVELRRGARLLNGDQLGLQTGVVEVTMRTGVRIVIEGPAELELNSEEQITLSQGKIVSHVPERAIGFVVSTPLAEIVDLGTSFGAGIPEDGKNINVEVFQGVVELRPSVSGGKRIRLTSGQKLTLNHNGNIDHEPNSEITFARDLPAKPATLIGLYSFEGDGRITAGTASDSPAVINVEFVDGFEGKAARFSGNMQSFINLPINANPERIPVMTWGAWVRPARVATRHAILSTGDGGFDRTLTIDERMGVGAAGQSHYAAFGGPEVGVLRSTSATLPVVDKWAFVAAVYDHPAATVTLFTEGANGQLHQDQFHSARPGPALVHIRVGTHVFAKGESFAGEIDNVFVYSGRLDATQLESIRAGGAEAIIQLSQQAASDNSLEESLDD